MRRLERGDVLGDTYEIEEYLDSGGSAEVYLAYNRGRNRRVAIKVLHETIERNGGLAMLLREVDQGVSHPAVVRYYDMLQSDSKGGFHYLVMEFIDGPSLQERMREGPVPAQELMRIGRALASGLAAAHRADILHRDISPDNVLLRGGEPAGATLIDFGLAKDLRPAAESITDGGFAGKYVYAAPEVLDGRVAAHSDIYALGATLLAAARGETPEEPAGLGALYEAKRRPLDFGGLDERLARTLSAMCDPDPARRPDAEAVAEAFGGKVEARRRRPRWLLPAAAALALAVSGAGLWFGLLRPPLAAPYRFVADPAAGTVSGHAPDAAAERRLIEAARAAFGREPAETIERSRGAPEGADWAEGLARLMAAASGLVEWRLEAEDGAARLEGLAETAEARDRIVAALEAAARSANLRLALAIRAKPPAIDLEALRALVAAYDDCGALALDGGGPGATGPLVVTGRVSGADRATALGEELRAGAGVRGALVEADALNPAVCRVLKLLPPAEAAGLEIRYFDEGWGVEKPDDAFGMGEMVIAAAALPAGLGGRLAAFIVGNDGHVINLLPYSFRPDDAAPDDGRARLVPLAFPREEADETRPGIETADPPGVSVMVALVTDETLFAPPRLISERVEEFEAEFGPRIAALAARGDLRALVWRRYDVR